MTFITFISYILEVYLYACESMKWIGVRTQILINITDFPYESIINGKHIIIGLFGIFINFGNVWLDCCLAGLPARGWKLVWQGCQQFAWVWVKKDGSILQFSLEKTGDFCSFQDSPYSKQRKIIDKITRFSKKYYIFKKQNQGNPAARPGLLPRDGLCFLSGTPAWPHNQNRLISICVTSFMNDPLKKSFERSGKKRNCYLLISQS